MEQTEAEEELIRKTKRDFKTGDKRRIEVVNVRGKRE